MGFLTDMVEFFEKWFGAKRRPIGPLDISEAKIRHESRIPYVAVLELDGTKHVLEIAGEWVAVRFFDSYQRVFLIYDFKRIEGDRIFLSRAMHFEYKDAAHEAENSVTFVFSIDGSIFIEKRNLATGDISEIKSHGETSPNWDIYPSFGIYNSLCRVSRV